ncbi:hypothetical protein CBER1_04972 [Cercospora berteroae]|uniref:Uncharacterized protein n=1 Tax=Cercospora berteroae TaxID=357750 RepID=A0A2S6CJF2_9PEZI|nr:hypothetical protein CBER1_04972 [Cercospora berteroae]
MERNEHGNRRPGDRQFSYGSPSPILASMQLDSARRKRPASLPQPSRQVHDPVTPTHSHAAYIKRLRFDTDLDNSISCQTRCGYPVETPLHQPLPWCHSNVPLIEARVLDICDQFAALVEQHESGISAPVMARCQVISQKKDLKLLYPLPKPAAVVGSMGAGKSQLINALLGLPGAAITSATDRGTNATLEFRNRRPDQETKFVLKVIFHTPDEIKKRLREYLQIIHTYLSLKAQYLNPDNEVDVDEVEEHRKKYCLAYDMLYTTLYGSRLTLKVKGETEEHEVADLARFKDFLDSVFDSNAPFEDLDLHDTVAILYSKIPDFMAAQHVSDDVKICEIDDLGELRKAMHKTIRPVSTATDVPHLWPLVRKAVLHCEGIDSLEMGVSIGDTAGLADENEYVVNNTLNYLSTAGTILLVAPVLRIARSKELNAQLKLSISMGKASSTLLVATKADRLDPDIKASGREMLSEEDRASFEAAEAIVQKLGHESKKLEEKKQRLKDDKLWEQHGKCKEQLKDLEIRKAKAARDKLRVVRQISQRKTELDLKDKFRQLTPSGSGPDLKVYLTATKGSDDDHGDEGPTMSEDELLDTGVPAIAQLLFEKPAGERFKVMVRTCTTRLPQELQAIINMLKKSPGEMHQDIRTRIVTGFDRGIKDIIAALAADMRFRLWAPLAEAFDEKNKTDWISRSGPKISVWATWNPRTVFTACKKEGFWKSPSHVYLGAWSHQIQNVFAPTVAGAFEQMKSIRAPIMENLTNNVKDSILTPLKEDTAITSLGEEGNNLGQTILKESRKLTGYLRVLAEELRTSVDEVCRRATAEKEDTYDCDELKSTDSQAASFRQKNYGRLGRFEDRLARGNSALADRIHTLRDKICEKGPDNLFDRVQTLTEAGLQQAIDEWIQKVRERLEKMKENVLSDFDSRYADDEELKKVDQATRDAIIEAAELAKERLEDEVLPLLEECKMLNDKVAQEEAMEDD